jgi:hypothetical protein
MTHLTWVQLELLHRSSGSAALVKISAGAVVVELVVAGVGFQLGKKNNYQFQHSVCSFQIVLSLSCEMNHKRMKF